VVEWALDNILFLNLVEAAGALRGEYDDLQNRKRTPKFGNEWGMKLLHAILKLGGKLSSEENLLTARCGPPSAGGEASPGAGRGLREGVRQVGWAPRAQRQKEAEARNAPPPRIPEDKLPKFMRSGSSS